MKSNGLDKIKKILLSEVKMDVKDKIVYKNALRGYLYFFSILFIWGMGKRLISYPFKLAQIYNLDVNQVAELVFKNYNITIAVIMIIAILAVPIYEIFLRLKKLGLESLEFFDHSEQSIERITIPDIQTIDKDISNIIVQADDKNLDDEECEKELINKSSKEDYKNINDIKSDNVIEYMNPITQKVLLRLYYNRLKISVTSINCILDSIRRYRRMRNEQKVDLANDIIAFLVNNDIIESDEMEDSYYFTNFADVVVKKIGEIK